MLCRLPGDGLATTVAQALAHGIATGLPRLDAQLLLLHALKRRSHERAWLHAHDQDAVEQQAYDQFRLLCQRRAAGEPLAYLVGTREFHGLSLAVDARVLDPRPDTEILVDWAIEVGRGRINLHVLDLGCGSGAIALAIKHARTDAVVQATDASVAALQVAHENATALGLDVIFSEHDWLKDLPGSFDLIVSNPPYIALGDPHLAALRHEPLDALVSGPDGLDAIRQIVKGARAHLSPNGWLLLEHGHDQAAAVRGLLMQAGFRDVQSRRDLGDIERCSGGRHRAGA